MKKRKTPPQELNAQPQLPVPDTSPVIPQRNKIKNLLNIYQRPDFTEKQKEFIELALDKKTKLLFVSGPAGSTKSYLSVYCALKLLNDRRVSDLIYVRSIVESAEYKIGYLPGEIDSKVLPYMEPLYDKLSELLPKNEVDYLKKDHRITTIPVSFLRGLNFNAKCVIADEIQNMTMKELITLTTRVGEHSKIILAGDPEQSDLKNGNRGGFEKIMGIFDDDESRQNGIFTFRFTEEHVLRSKLVKFIVKKLRGHS